MEDRRVLIKTRLSPVKAWTLIGATTGGLLTALPYVLLLLTGWIKPPFAEFFGWVFSDLYGRVLLPLVFIYRDLGWNWPRNDFVPWLFLLALMVNALLLALFGSILGFLLKATRRNQRN
jgi:hypothetical protein